jgi:hypothetical protein
MDTFVDPTMVDILDHRLCKMNFRFPKAIWIRLPTVQTIGSFPISVTSICSSVFQICIKGHIVATTTVEYRLPIDASKFFFWFFQLLPSPIMQTNKFAYFRYSLVGIVALKCSAAI